MTVRDRWVADIGVHVALHPDERQALRRMSAAQLELIEALLWRLTIDRIDREREERARARLRDGERERDRRLRALPDDADGAAVRFALLELDR